MKQVFKKIAIWFSSGLLVVLLLILPSAFLFTFILSQPQSIKDILRQSEIYPAFSKAIVDTSASLTENSGSGYGLSKEATRRVAEKAFPASDIQQKSEGLIDDGFVWLEGDKPAFEIRLDLEKNKQLLVQGLSEEVVTAAASKPICTNEQLQQFASQDQMASLLATCRPSTLDANSLKAALEQNVSTLPISDVNQVAASVPSTDSSLPQQDILPTPKLSSTIHGISIPSVFRVLRNGFYIVLALIVVVGLILFGLTRQLSRFLSVISHPLMTTGILLVVYALVGQWFVNQNILSKLIPGEPSHLLETTAQLFMAVSVDVIICFGASYIVFATVMYIYNHRQKQKQSPDQTTQATGILNAV